MRVHLGVPTPVIAVLTATVLLAGCGDDGGPADAARATSPASSATAPSAGPSSATVGTPTTAADGVAVGELVAGFPTDVIPVLAGSSVTLSTLVPGEGVRQVSLSGTTSAPAADVLAYYRAALAGQGFAESSAPAPAGVLGATFSRGDATDLLTVVVTTVGDVQQFTVGGQLAG